MKPRERLIQAAALVIRQDRKLLGIPSVRNPLIYEAVDIALGKRPMRDAPRAVTQQHSENNTAILDALRRAVEAVRAEQRRINSQAA